MSNDVTAQELARLVSHEHGETFRVHCCGVWSEHKGASASALEIDVGGGFVPAVRVNGSCHTTYLIGPFSLETRGSYLSTLRVFCDNYFLLREAN